MSLWRAQSGAQTQAESLFNSGAPRGFPPPSLIDPWEPADFLTAGRAGFGEIEGQTASGSVPKERAKEDKGELPLTGVGRPR